MAKQKVYTVVCTYQVPLASVHDGRLFYDCKPADSPAMAIALIAPQCPGTPTDILVFKGELYDQLPDKEILQT